MTSKPAGRTRKRDPLTVKHFTSDEICSLLTSEADGDNDWLSQTRSNINRWLGRGDGVAIYKNRDLTDSEHGRRQIVSYGSPDAQLETDQPAQRLPDIGSAVNWRYQLEGTYRGDTV